MKDKEQQKEKKQKKMRHLVSDETLIEKYGVSPDEDAENDSDAPEHFAAEPLEGEARKKRKKTWIILLVVTVCAVAAILWLAIPNTGKSHYDNNMSGIVDDVLEVQEGYPATISGTSVTSGNFWVMDKELVYVSDTSLVRLDQNAETVFERNHSFYHPITKTSGSYLMVYNVGSNGFRIDTTTETVVSEESDNTLMAADVAENGRYAIVTEAKGYQSVLFVYREDGTLQYKYSFSSCYVIDLSLNEDGTRAAVIGMTASEGELVSQVYLLDFNSETPLTIVDCEGTLLMAVSYCSDGRALCVGDDKVISVNESGEKTEYDYGDRQLSGYDYNGSKVLVGLSPYDTASSSSLAVINSKGEEVAVQSCEGTIDDVSLYGDTMAMLSGQVVYSYSVNAVRNYRGEEGTTQEPFNVTEAASDTKAIALADESAVYLLGISEVRFEDF